MIDVPLIGFLHKMRTLRDFTVTVFQEKRLLILEKS